MGALFSLWTSKSTSSWSLTSPIAPPTLSSVPDEPGLWVFFPSESSAAVTLPLTSVSAKIQIRDIAARVKLIQTFGNTHNTHCEEAVFNFKLEEGVVVCAFEARIGSSCVQGFVKENSVAHEEYAEAKEAGYSAFLMEESVRTKHMFSLRLGNIPPRVHVAIVLTFACTLVSKSSKYSSAEAPLDMLKLRLSADCLVPSKVVTRRAPRSASEMDLRGMDAQKFQCARTKLNVRSAADFDISAVKAALFGSSNNSMSLELKSCPSNIHSNTSSSAAAAAAAASSSSALLESSPAVIHTPLLSLADSQHAVALAHVNVSISVSIEACGAIAKLECPGTNESSVSSVDRGEPTATYRHENRQGEVEWRWDPLLLRRTSSTTQFELHIHFTRVTQPVMMLERLCINVRESSSAVAASAVGAAVGGENMKQDYALLLSFNPDLLTYERSTISRLNSELIFVIDRSGSMSGRRIERTKATLYQVLKILPSEVYFNFVGFGSQHALMWPESKQADIDNLWLARDYINVKLRADMGGTKIYPPLSDVLASSPKEGYARQVFLLTDGEIDNQEQALVLSLLRNHSDSTRVFAFGLGNEVGREQIKLIAEASRGKPFYISDDDANANSNVMCEVISKQLRQALAPCMTHMSFFWDGLEATETPFRLRPAYHDEPYRVFVLLSVAPEQLSRTHHVKLSGRLPNGTTMRFALDLQLSSLLSDQSISSSGISQLAARAMARDIEENGSALQLPYPECYKSTLQYFLLDDLVEIVIEYSSADGLVADASLARKELLRLGMTFQIINSLTSFVCVDRSTVSVVKSASKKKLPSSSSSYKSTSGPRTSVARPSLRLFSQMYARRETRSLMLGLDNAGKTTILYHLRLGEVITTTPTIGFNVESVDFHGVSVTMWDIGGQDKIRPLWRHYYQNTQCVVFVVDSTDASRFPDVKQAMQSIAGEAELQNCYFLVLANKQDCSEACSVLQLAWEIGLCEWRKDNWFIQGCSGLTGTGLSDGLAWLAKKLLAH